MDARGCRGCNAKDGKVCWSYFLGEQAPVPIKELKECPDQVLGTLDALDDGLGLLEEEFTKLAKGGKDASSSKE